MKIPLVGKLDHHMHEVMRGASVAFVLKIVGAVLSFGVNILLARTLGADGAGIYFLALTASMVGSVIGRFGLENAMLRHIASGAAENHWRSVRSVHRFGIRLGLAVSASVACLMVGLSSWLAEEIFSKPELAELIRWIALAIVPHVMLTLQAESLKGLKRIRDSQLINGVGVPLLNLLGIWLLATHWGVVGATVSYVISVSMTMLLGWWLWRSACEQGDDVGDIIPSKTILQGCRPLFIVALANLVFMSTQSIVLGVFGPSSDVGLFNVANRTAALTSFVLMAVNSIAAPKFSALYAKGDMRSLARLARTSSALMLIWASPLLLVFWVVPEWIMSFFGEEFQSATLILSILAVGYFVNVAAGSVGYLLIMSGHERQMRGIALISAALNILSSIVLVPNYGVLGAALANAVSLSTMNLIAVWTVWRRLGINMFPFVKSLSVLRRA